MLFLCDVVLGCCSSHAAQRQPCAMVSYFLVSSRLIASPFVSSRLVSSRVISSRLVSGIPSHRMPAVLCAVCLSCLVWPRPRPGVMSILWLYSCSGSVVLSHTCASSMMSHAHMAYDAMTCTHHYRIAMRQDNITHQHTTAEWHDTLAITSGKTNAPLSMACYLVSSVAIWSRLVSCLA